MKKIVIGSRESALAVVQSNMVLSYLREAHPETEASLLTMKTTGDKILDRRLDQIGGKGLFVKELDAALLSGKSDFSVHSLKDLPMDLPEELPLVCFSKREDPRDVLVLPEGKTSIDFSLPIGTSSLRRILQLQKLFPEARFESIRGNLQTRLRKLDEGQYGAIILAAAGMKRMGLSDRISRFFSVEEVIPAAGQAILAIQGRKDCDASLFEGFMDQNARTAALAERAFVRELDGGCSSPVAAHAIVNGSCLRLLGLYYNEETREVFTGELTGSAAQAEELGKALAGQLRSAGQKKTGKVFLVGAGPGDRGLFTLKGKEILSRADVVVYDSLVGPGILCMIPDTAEAIDVGKRASNHTMPQAQINALLLQEAMKGKTVVRLKGGDPFLFGRGGEELELLVENHIPYEIVPGITSPISVPAYNGIPVTHRDFTSSLHIITGHKRAVRSTEVPDGKEASPVRGWQNLDIPFEALVNTGGTLVFLMGVTSLPDICAGLLAAGMDPAMPAAILQKGTTARQKRIVATVSTLCGEVQRCGIETPAIIVVGKVCSLSETFSWYEALPLSGARILVTRPKELVSTVSEKLRLLGAEVLEIPSTELLPIPDNQALSRALSEISSYRWIAFTSPSGVRIFFQELAEREIDIRSLSHLRFAVLGEGTKKELKAHQILADVMPEVYDGASLGKALAGVMRPEEKLLLPRAEIGSREILTELAGFIVDDIPLYQTVYRKQNIIPLQKLFADGEIDCCAFTSSSGVKAFLEAYPELEPALVNAVCIGKQTAHTAREAGMHVAVAEKPTIDSLIERIIKDCTAR